MRLKVWSRFTIVNAAAEASRSLPLPSGVAHGPDGAAGVDDMEGDVATDQDDSPVFIQMPDTASASEKLAFSRCDIFGRKGSSSWHVKCTFCGRTVTTSQHKMIYGHYLQTEAGILPCLDKERLRDVDKEFLDELDAKQAKLTLKRK